MASAARRRKMAWHQTVKGGVIVAKALAGGVKSGRRKSAGEINGVELNNRDREESSRRIIARHVFAHRAPRRGAAQRAARWRANARARHRNRPARAAHTRRATTAKRRHRIKLGKTAMAAK